MAKFDQDGNTKKAFRAFSTTDRFNLLFWCYLPPLSVLQDRKQSFSQETNSSHFLLDLYMSSLTDKSKMSFMEYLTRTESDDDFEELSHIRGYVLDGYDEDGNERDY